MTFFLLMLPQITCSQNFLPNYTLVPGQSIVIRPKNNTRYYDGYDSCTNISTYIENEENHEYIQIKPEYFNIDIIALQRIYCIYSDSFTYLFAILFNNTLLSLRLHDPKFFSDTAQQTIDLSTNLSTTIDSCYEMHRALDNTKFDIICVNKTHRIFVELFNNLSSGFPIKDLLFNISVIQYDNQFLKGRTLRNSSNYYIALFNSRIELYICQADCQHQSSIIKDFENISDLQLLNGDGDKLTFALSLRNEGFFIYQYNFANGQLYQQFQFTTYYGQQYLNLCVYSYTLWYGNDPSSIYPEIVLLTNNFVHIFKYLNNYVDETNILISSKRFQMNETQTEDYVDYLINQDDKYVYITRRNAQNQFVITYVQKSDDDYSFQQFPYLISDKRPFITVYDMIDKTTSLYNKNVHIFYRQNNFVNQQINKIQDNVIIIKSNTQQEKNCMLNNTYLIENINLNSTRILNVAQEKITFNTLKISQNMQEVFKGQLLNYSASVKSKRIKSYQIDIDKQINNHQELVIPYPQYLDKYCVIHSVYDPVNDLSFTLYQIQNKTIFLFKSYDYTRQWTATGYLNKFEQIDDYLLFSYYENESQTDVKTIIYNWRTNNTKPEIQFNQNYTSIQEDLDSIQQLSHFNQKIIYYYIKTKKNQFYIIYFRFLDENPTRLCIQFNESQYEIQYIQFDLQRYNLFIASVKEISTGDMVLVYFRLPIIKWEGCKIIKLFQIYIKDLQKTKDLEFWIVDYQFIDIEQPVSIVIMDFTKNTLNKYSIRDLKNITYKQEKFPLPLFEGINLSHQKHNGALIIGKNQYLRKGALYYCRVIYKFLILNIVENNTLQRIYKYDLLGESGNQVQILYEFQNVSNILIYFPKAYLSQQTKKSLREILRYGKGTITSDYFQQTFQDLSFNYKEIPTFQINLRTDQYFQSHIYGYEFRANNTHNSKSLSITIKTENLDINCQIVNSSKINVSSKDYVNLSMFQGPSLQYFIRDKINKLDINISFIQELQTLNTISMSHFEKYIYCSEYSYILTIQGEYDELLVYKQTKQSYFIILKQIFNISEVDGLCFNTSIQIVAIQKRQSGTQIIFFQEEYKFDQISFLKQLDFTLSPVNIKENNSFYFTLLTLYEELYTQKFFIFVQSQNTQYIFEIQHEKGINKLLNYSLKADVYQFVYKYKDKKDNILTYDRYNRNILLEDKTYPIYFDFDFIPQKPIIVNDSLIVFISYNNSFGLVYYDLTDSSSMKQYLDITKLKIIDVQYDPAYNLIIVKSIQKTYYYTIKPNISYSELFTFFQEYQDNTNSNYQLCSQTREIIKYNKCIDLELSNYDIDKFKYKLSLYFYFIIIPSLLMIIIIYIVICLKIKDELRNEQEIQPLRRSHNLSELVQ